jgi:hypothetical protein
MPAGNTVDRQAFENEGSYLATNRSPFLGNSGERLGLLKKIKKKRVKVKDRLAQEQMTGKMPLADRAQTRGSLGMARGIQGRHSRGAGAVGIPVGTGYN